jgi:hypothetical protein
MPGNSSNKRLTKRPMETPGLDVNSMPPQHMQYNYAQSTMYSQPPDPQTIPSQQQFYYNDFTSIPTPTKHTQHMCWVCLVFFLIEVYNYIIIIFNSFSR